MDAINVNKNHITKMLISAYFVLFILMLTTINVFSSEDEKVVIDQNDISPTLFDEYGLLVKWTNCEYSEGASDIIICLGIDNNTGSIINIIFDEVKLDDCSMGTISHEKGIDAGKSVDSYYRIYKEEIINNDITGFDALTCTLTIYADGNMLEAIPIEVKRDAFKGYDKISVDEYYEADEIIVSDKSVNTTLFQNDGINVGLDSCEYTEGASDIIIDFHIQNDTGSILGMDFENFKLDDTAVHFKFGDHDEYDAGARVGSRHYIDNELVNEIGKSDFSKLSGTIVLSADGVKMASIPIIIERNVFVSLEKIPITNSDQTKDAKTPDDKEDNFSTSSMQKDAKSNTKATNNDKAEKKTKVEEAYNIATTLTKDKMKKAQFDGWSYDGVEFIETDCDWVNDSENSIGQIKPGAFYRKMAYLLEGTEFLSYEKVAKFILGYVPETREEWEVQYDALKEYILKDDKWACFKAIIDKLNTLDSTKMLVDWENERVAIKIKNVNKCYKELGISPQMLGWIFAELDENGAESKFDGKKYTMTFGDVSVKDISKQVKSETERNIYSDAETIKTVQELLNQLGYDCGTPDGVAGNATNGAVEKFKAENGFSIVDNIIDDELIEQLKNGVSSQEFLRKQQEKEVDTYPHTMSSIIQNMGKNDTNSILQFSSQTVNVDGLEGKYILVNNRNQFAILLNNNADDGKTHVMIIPISIRSQNDGMNDFLDVCSILACSIDETLSRFDGYGYVITSQDTSIEHNGVTYELITSEMSFVMTY